jgi:hypothetical protein
MGWTCSVYVEMRNTYKVFVRKYKQKKPLSSPRHKREDNIKKFVIEIGFWKWPGLAWLRIGSTGRLL